MRRWGSKTVYIPEHGRGGELARRGDVRPNLRHSRRKELSVWQVFTGFVKFIAFYRDLCKTNLYEQNFSLCWHVAA